MPAPVSDNRDDVVNWLRDILGGGPGGDGRPNYQMGGITSIPRTQQGGITYPVPNGPSVADRMPSTPGGRGPVGRYARKKRKFTKDEQLVIFRSAKSRLFYLSSVSGGLTGAVGSFRNLGKGTFLRGLRNWVIGKPRIPPRLRIDAPAPPRIAPRGRLRSQGGMVDPALLGGNAARRVRRARGGRPISPPRPSEAPNVPSRIAIPLPRPEMFPLSVPETRPRTVPSTIPTPNPSTRPSRQPGTAPSPSTAAKIAKNSAQRANARAAAAAKSVNLPARGLPNEKRGRKNLKNFAKNFPAPRKIFEKFSANFPRPLGYFIAEPSKLARPQDLTSNMLGLTPSEQPQLALQPEPDLPGRKGRIRSSRGTRCPDRKGRKKGLCQQGYFRETPEGITYTKWSERKCQASSRKKPRSRRAR